jgi:hypothetical protein
VIAEDDQGAHGRIFTAASLIYCPLGGYKHRPELPGDVCNLLLRRHLQQRAPSLLHSDNNTRMTIWLQTLSNLIVYDTAYEGALYEGKVKTDDSRSRIPIPRRVRPYIEAWRKVCPNTSPDALIFPTQGHRKNKGIAGLFRAKNFFEWKGGARHRQTWHPRDLCTCQVFRRTLGTDLQKHGTMKDAQAILRTSTSRRPPRCTWTACQTVSGKPLTPGRRRYLSCAGRSGPRNLLGFS